MGIFSKFFKKVQTTQLPKSVTPFYCYGHLFSLLPALKQPYSQYLDLILESDFIVTDDSVCDLTDIASIRSLSIPPYEIHVENRIDIDMGVTGTLEYFLRHKGDMYWRAAEHVMAVACYAKATKMMAVSDAYWPEEDFYLIVDRLSEIGQHKVAQKWYDWLQKTIYGPEEEIDRWMAEEELSKTKTTTPTNQLSTVEKETIMVQRVSTEDMLQFPQLPYNLDAPVHKFIREGGHPYAYINLDYGNQTIAIKHLQLLNNIIKKARSQVPALYGALAINVNKIAFQEYSPQYGYTRLMCAPHTFTGKPSAHPLTLSFMTNLDTGKYSALGQVVYRADGSIARAEAHIYRNHSGYHFYFSELEGELTLMQVKSLSVLDERGLPSSIYKHESIIAEERAREHDRQLYEWLERHLPDICPKTFAAFRRMKNANSANYQKIVAEAAKLGKTW